MAPRITWKKIRPYVKMALENGEETLIHKELNVYKRVVKLDSGFNVEVRFIKDSIDDIWRLGTAFVQD